MQPPFPYFGGKQSLAPLIASLLPKHGHYVEPFCGSLAVLLAKRASHMETVNDLDGDLMHFWRMLRDRPDDLIRACELTPHSRADFLATYEAGEDDLERARRVWARLAQGRSPSLRNTRTGWRHNVDPRHTPMPSYLDGYRSRLLPVAERIRNVSLESQPAVDLIREYGRFPQVLLYIDPPYVGATRAQCNAYRHEMRDDAEHRELAEALTSCKAMVVLSGYHSPLYDDLYDGWHCYEMTTATGNAAVGAQERTEVLWSNRALSSQMDLFAEQSDMLAS